MVSSQEIDRQLKAIGADFRFWGRAEANELEHIIMPGEQIAHCLNGHYEHGFAMLCVTDHRVIVIDKKPLYLELEDIRYEMISELDFSQRLFDATLTVFTFSKTLKFTAFKMGSLRTASAYIQSRIIDTRSPQSPAALLQSMANASDQPPVHPAEPQMSPLARPVTHPYTSMPLTTRRRLSRYY